MRLVRSSPLLRNVLIVDAAFSGASGVTLAQTSPTPLGLAAVIGQATVVAAIAAAQAVGLRQSSAYVPEA